MKFSKTWGSELPSQTPFPFHSQNMIPVIFLDWLPDFLWHISILASIHGGTRLLVYLSYAISIRGVKIFWAFFSFGHNVIMLLLPVEYIYFFLLGLTQNKPCWESSLPDLQTGDKLAGLFCLNFSINTLLMQPSPTNCKPREGPCLLCFIIVPVPGIMLEVQ